MPLIFLSLLSLNNSKFTALLENASLFSEKAHKVCVDWTPILMSYPEILDALLCGKNITDETTQSLLIKSSLIHLFVVSGSHLLLINEILLRVRLPAIFRILGMGAYCFVCQWQAPVVRAWIGILTREGLRQKKIYLPSDLLVFFSGVLCLSFFPNWISSRSFLMSWLAALALSLGFLWQDKKIWQKLILSSTTIYLFMLPALWGFGNLHPLSIALNIFLAPLISFALFPLAILTSVLPFLTPLFSKGLDLFFFLSTHGAEPVQMQSSRPLPLQTLWILNLSLQFLIHLGRIQRKRRALCIS